MCAAVSKPTAKPSKPPTPAGQLPAACLGLIRPADDGPGRAETGPRATGRKERKMTVFQELTKGMKFSEPSEDIKKNMVKVFKKNFGCPPWNDEYEEGCAAFAGCESCWFGYINSEAK